MRKVTELASTASSSSSNRLKPIDDPLEYMEKVIDDCFADIRNAKVTQVATNREFRTSSLPFCPILDFLREPQEENYDKSHYTSTGTAIHETLQSWLSVANYPKSMLYGSWKCTGCQNVLKNQMMPKKLCGCKHTMSTTPFHRKWPKHWTYEEIEYNYNGLSGHIDGVLMPRPDFAFVIDFKTTELAKKRSKYNWKADKISSPAYVAQIRTYSTILTLEHDLPIKGWMLINVERGRPIKSKNDYHKQVGTWGEKHSIKWDGILQRSIKHNILLSKLERAVEEKKKDRAQELLQKIVACRPCKSEHDYKRYMVYKHYDGKCPHADVCFSGKNKPVYTRIMDELSKKE